MNPSKIVGLLKDTFQQFNEDKAPRLGAALAYYALFSIAPLLIIAIAIAGLVFGADAARGQIVGAIQDLVGKSGAEAIQSMIQASSKPSTSVLASIIGIATLLLGAAGLFGQLQDALDTMWEVAPKPNAGILGMIQQRFFSFTMVLGTAFLLLVSLVISAGLAAIGKFWTGLLPGGTVLWEGVNFVISLAVITGIFALLFKVVPDARIAWNDVWIGAALTASLFTIGKFLIGLYLGHSSVSSTYGAAGSLVIVLLWIYYTSQILFFGAEFTQVYANKYGSRVVPKKNAVPLTEKARIQQGIPRTEHVEAAAKSGRSVASHAAEGGDAETTDGERPAQPSAPQSVSGITASGPFTMSALVVGTLGLAGAALLSILAFFGSLVRLTHEPRRGA